MLERALVAIGERAARRAQGTARSSLARRAPRVTPYTPHTPPQALQHVHDVAAAAATAVASDDNNTRCTSAVQSVCLLSATSDALTTSTAQLHLQAQMAARTMTQQQQLAYYTHGSSSSSCVVDGDGSSSSSSSDSRLLHERVLAAAYTYPRTLAVDVVAVLLEAGRADDAVRLLAAWRGDGDRGHDHTTLRAYATTSATSAATAATARTAAVAVTRARACRSRRAAWRLRRAMHTLRQLRDAATLRSLLRVLTRTRRELESARGDNNDDHTCNDSSSSSAHAVTKRVVSYGLLASLGRRRVRRLHACAVAALCALDCARDGVSVVEQLSALDTAVVTLPSLSTCVATKTATTMMVDNDDNSGSRRDMVSVRRRHATTTADKAAAAVARVCVLPPSLYAVYAANVARQASWRDACMSPACPARLRRALLLHPSQYDALMLLSLPPHEQRAAWRVWPAARWLAHTQTTTTDTTSDATVAATRACTASSPPSPSRRLHSSSSSSHVASDAEVAWTALCAQCLRTSLPLQRMRATACLLVTLLDDKTTTTAASARASVHEVARRVVVAELLQSPHREVRQCAAARLLQLHRCRRRAAVLSRLRLPLHAVAATYALAATKTTRGARTRRALSPVMCVRLVCALARRGDELRAARIAWSHLGNVPPPPQQQQERKSCAHVSRRRRHRRHDRVVDVDALTACMCRALHTLRTQRTHTTPSLAWCAHRTLAVLRRVATMTTTTTTRHALTPMHCIPVCAWALQCGVRAHTVRRFVHDVLQSTTTTTTTTNTGSEDSEDERRRRAVCRALQQWTFDVACLCAADDVPAVAERDTTATTASLRVLRADRTCLAAPMRALVVQATTATTTTTAATTTCACVDDACAAVTLTTAPRSRQAALWRLLLQLSSSPHAGRDVRTTTTTSPVLSALLALLFLDADARHDVLLCNGWLTTNATSVRRRSSPPPLRTEAATTTTDAHDDMTTQQQQQHSGDEARAMLQYVYAYDTLAALACSCHDECAYRVVLQALRHAHLPTRSAALSTSTTAARTRVDCLAASEGHEATGTRVVSRSRAAAAAAA